MIEIASPDERTRRTLLSRRMLSAAAHHPWVRAAAIRLPGARQLALRFVAGERLEDALACVRALEAEGASATVNQVGTHERAADSAVIAGDNAVEALERLCREGLSPNLSVKPTKLGLDVDAALCGEQLRRVVAKAVQVDGFVWIDMEEAAYTAGTIGLFEELREQFGRDAVGIALQSYLRDRQADFDRLVSAGSRIRLVKGGYVESSAVVYRSAADVDAAFLADIEALFQRGAYRPAIATHDVRAIRATVRAAEAAGVDGAGFEFQMLYGVESAVRRSLVRAGHTVRCYVPYGQNWYDYVLGCVRQLPGTWIRRVRRDGRTRTAGAAGPRSGTTGRSP